MAKSPFYKIVFIEDNYNISDIVSSLQFEDCVEQDNLVTIQIGKANNELIDNLCSRKGKEINFSYGFIDGKRTPTRSAKLKNVIVRYGSTINVTLKALDDGFIIKKHRSNTVYDNLTTSEIVSLIASKYELKTDIQKTTDKISIPQANKTYYEFIKRLAKKEGFIFYIKDNTVIFKKRDLSTNAIKLYEYNNGNGNLLVFTPKYEDNPGANKTSSSGLDSETGELFNVESQPSETGLGKKLLRFDIFGNQLNDSSESGKFEVLPETNQNKIKSQTDKSADDSALKSMTADVDLELDLSINIEDIITITGVAKEHIGNWYINKKTDYITGSGGNTKLSVNKNATNNTEGGNGDPNSINKSIGDKDPSNEADIEIRVYDVNGKRIQ